MTQRLIPELYEWMKYLPNVYFLSEFSIPGTHDSCASKNVANFFQCQSEDITWQLNNGIRYLDIRCAIYTDGGKYGYFKVHHGNTYVKVTFGKVLRDCFSFLSANPSETIIMRVQQEWTSDIALYKRIFNDYLSQHENKFYLGDTVPTLGDVRGKIVLITGTPWVEKGLKWVEQVVQDEWNGPSFTDKENKVKAAMDSSPGGPIERLHINHLSATSKLPPRTPLDYALHMNQFTLSLIWDHFQDRYKLGIVAYDYAGTSTSNYIQMKDSLLAQAIIARNRFRNWPPPATTASSTSGDAAMYIDSSSPLIQSSGRPELVQILDSVGPEKTLEDYLNEDAAPTEKLNYSEYIQYLTSIEPAE